MRRTNISKQHRLCASATHRRPPPGDASHFVWVWAEFVVTQWWRQSLKVLVLEQLSSLQTASPQGFKILVQVFLGMTVGSNPVSSVAVVLKLGCHSRHFETLLGCRVFAHLCCPYEDSLCVVPGCFLAAERPRPSLLVSNFNLVHLLHLFFFHPTCLIF